MTSASTAYISASTNRFNHAADASTQCIVAFGSSKLIAVWDATDKHDRGVLETLPGHGGLVTCVRFVRDDLFVSGDEKGSLKCWRKFGSEWKSTRAIQAHSKTVSALAVLKGQCLVTGGSDSCVKIWELSPNETSDELKELQVLPLQGRYPLSLALANLPQSNAIILAIASTDRNVQIWIRSEDNFVRSAVLSGHEDWVRSLAFRVPLENVDPLILASGSQDGAIRLWNIETYSKDKKPFQNQNCNAAEEPLSDNFLDTFEASLGHLGDAEEGSRQISLKHHVLTVKSNQGRLQQFSITFDALLIGHEAGITSLSWRPISMTSKSSSTPTLLSTSTDSSLILWSPSTVLTSQPSHDGSTSIWINRQRFGDVGGQRLGGFIGGLWSREGQEVMAWGWAGGWRRWRCDSIEETGEDWGEVGAIGGHNGPIKGIDWSPQGEYLISTGLDQTTRIHGAIPIIAEDGVKVKSWHEIGRPQVHGYDLIDVAFLDPLQFVSIADEKVARVFEAPRGFIRIVKGLQVSELTPDEGERPLAATVPPLGLSNKAISEVNPQLIGGTLGSDNSSIVRRPFDGELVSMTLWPEIEKIFGHGYESISLAVSNSRKLVATACKATTAEHAVVRVYDTEKWQLVGQPLEGHSLTVTRITFSPDDRFILSVSRDRTWRLFEKQDNGFVPIAADKSHARIIWDCAWAHECDVFATGSRDKSVKIWNLKDKESDKKWIPAASIKTKEPVTAIAFASKDPDGRRRLAVGLETGDILVYSGLQTNNTSSWNLDVSLDSRIAHVDQIHQLAWRPGDQTSDRELATCSEDGTLKILIVHVGMH